VKKGAKSFYILAPLVVKKDDEERLIGFKPVAVFRAEDTDGQPLDYQSHQLPELPLMDKANEWGVNVKAVPGNYQYYGFFSQARKEIGLATPDECVFFHELSHAGHCRIVGGLKPGQDPMQEVVAELCGAALCRLVGKSGGKYFGNAYRYIGRYAEKLKITPVAACLRALRECELTLKLILNGGGNVLAENQ
jgi:hypothetical protein